MNTLRLLHTEPEGFGDLDTKTGSGQGRAREVTLHMEDEDVLHQLMIGIRAGSSSALQKLIDASWPTLVRYAARQLSDIDLAEDVVQEAFIYLWRHRDSWTPSGSQRAYLFRVVRNRLIDEKRKRNVRARWASARKHLTGPPATPDEVLSGTALLAAFDQAVANLPDRRREAFNLVFLSGLSHEEAADVMEIAKQTVSNQVTAALAELRAALAGVSDEFADE